MSQVRGATTQVLSARGYVLGARCSEARSLEPGVWSPKPEPEP
jgi:hypothetical protein